MMLTSTFARLYGCAVRSIASACRAIWTREAEYMRKYQLGAEIFHSGRAATTPAEAEALAIWEGAQW